jgi:hypothetical protein
MAASTTVLRVGRIILGDWERGLEKERGSFLQQGESKSEHSAERRTRVWVGGSQAKGSRPSLWLGPDGLCGP